MEELFSFRAVLYGSPTTSPIPRPEAEEQDRSGGIWEEVRHLSFYCFGAGMAVDIVCPLWHHCDTGGPWPERNFLVRDARKGPIGIDSI